jgi:CDP-diacylglycerol--glycerol-3-phosphate 3-phosphatidyltransferase
MIDLAASSLVGLAGVTTAIAWAVSSGHEERIERLERGGASPLLGAGVQRAGYRWLDRLGRALSKLGVGANAVTLSSIPFAAGAAIALGTEHYGVGAVLAGVSYACDAVDGVIARATGTASAAGEILDAVCDRICEALMLGGLAVAWRDSVGLLVLALAAEVGAQQVTLATAKADAFPSARERVPRGLMRRVERAAYLVAGAAIAGALADLLPAPTARFAARIPLAAALVLFAVLGNASALSRFAALSLALRTKGGRHADR